jgi:hypothetical protein
VEDLVVFREKDHKYFRKIDNHELAGVSSLVKEVKEPYKSLPPPDQEYLEYLGKLGKYVHRACELDLHGQLDERTIVSPVKEYFQGYLKAKKLLNIRPICTERLVYNLDIGFAGRTDLRAIVNLEQKDLRATIDFKTSFNPWEHFKWQLGGYHLGWWSLTPPDRRPENLIEWELAGESIWLPRDPNEERLIVLYLTAKCDFFIEVWPKPTDEPYQVQEEFVECVHKYWYNRGGYDGEVKGQIAKPTQRQVTRYSGTPKKRGRPKLPARKPDYGL